MYPAANNSVPQSLGTPIPGSRQRRTSQTTSSAFSACASPNEDWTKISDFEERRRVQTRIAQRNYRIKQKQRLEQPEKRIESSLPAPELTHEEIATPGSTSDLSHPDSQQQEVQNFYDISTPEAPQQQCPPLSNDYVVPLQQFSPQLSTPQPRCAHTSTSEASCLFHTGGQQQPTHSFNCPPLSNDYIIPLQQFTPQLSTSQSRCARTSTSDASCLFHTCGQQQSTHNFNYPPLSNDYIIPLQQFTPQLSTPQPRCTHTSTSEVSCFFHTGGQQQPTHNFNCPPVSNDSGMFSQQFAPQLSTSQPPCACMPMPTSGSASCHSQPGDQQQRMHNFYDRAPLPSSQARSEDHTRTSYGHFEASCGAPVIDLNLPLVFPRPPSSPSMALPPPTKRGCCCRHNHMYPPTIGHAVPMDSFDMHPSCPCQDTAQGHMLVTLS